MNCSTICVKVANLRKVYGKDMNLREWVKNPDNILCCRNGRIFIDGEIFTYPKSKWSNPYKVGKDGNLDEVCEKFEKYIMSSDLSCNLNELKGKCLGCFCDQSGKCHVKISHRCFNVRYNAIYNNGCYFNSWNDCFLSNLAKNN